MDYAEFKTFLTTFLWKVGDTQLIASLDNLVQMADAELTRKLPITERAETTEVVATSNTVPVPSGTKHIVAVSTAERGPFRNVTRAELDRQRSFYQADPASAAVSVYHLQNFELLLAGGYSVAAPTTLTVTTRHSIPNFFADDSSWLADDYLDLYVYAVLKHTAPFLREDERVALWDKLYSDALNSVIENDLFHKTYGGSPLHMPLPYNIA